VLLPKVGVQMRKHRKMTHLHFFPGIYNDEFFAGIDGVTNALDNVTARKQRSAFFIFDYLTFFRTIHGQEVYHL
jgi:hypothetical protein